ncbi:hypothetical protein [Terrabacter sp. NPDC080008]|uniref:hypothetical protein n=1 Tax=Terrabacter sp. NPDC080008 TaxID=3155176 RepID=UPI00344DBD8B
MSDRPGRARVVVVLAVIAVVVCVGVWALVAAVHPEVAGVTTCDSRYVPGQGPRFSCEDSSGAQARFVALLGLTDGSFTVTSPSLLWLARVLLLGPVLAFVIAALVQGTLRPGSARGQLRNARIRRALRRRR